ncbi:RNA polymerase sigma factor [Pseudotamlana agarivorans]|uniref:RNA polymerase sigma factor n=1 Tax=Pseudotamlana agarivorans TaxID=481183 RepID=UPI00082A8568|nr:sigma-70 family RNA polymerase sigma factor [Tamlana agarivorans]
MRKAKQLNFNDISDENLLLYVKAGNHSAFNQIYNKYWERLYISVYNVLMDKSLTEDVLHEVFSDIWLRKEELQIRNLNSYLFKSVRNNALLKIRNDKYVGFNSVILETLTLNPEIELDLDHRELKTSIEQIMLDLPSRCRSIFYMSRFQNYSITEIALHFGISHRTVENQLHRALKHLRTALGSTLFIHFFC